MAYGDPYRDPEEEGSPAPSAPPPGGAAPPGGAPAPDPAMDPAAAGAGHHGHGGGGAPDLGPQYNYAGLPGFVAPTYAKPTMEQALQEPGYQFRLGAGSDALQRSAAARGVLRSGGTLQDLLEYGQKFGQQEYGNVYNRSLQEYDRRYQGAKDAYAPLLAQWQTKAGGEIQRALAVYNAQHRGGGGGGGYQPSPDEILGPPPVAPDYAQAYASQGTGTPASYSGSGAGYDDDPYRQY